MIEKVFKTSYNQNIFISTSKKGFNQYEIFNDYSI